MRSLCRAYRTELRPFAAALLLPLLANVPKTVQAISEPSYKALRSLIRHVRPIEFAVMTRSAKMKRSGGSSQPPRLA